MSPPRNCEKGSIFNGTPICNSRMFDLVRKGRCSWVRGDIENFTADGIVFNRRKRGVAPGGEGEITVEKGQVVILATGFKRPQHDFFPASIRTSKYKSPNFFLQAFPTEDASVAAINCTWLDGIGSIGGAHTGVYTRFLLAFLIDQKARPTTAMMQRWVDTIEMLKRPHKNGPLAFVTIIELWVWFFILCTVQPTMWKWLGFVIYGPESSNGVPEQFKQHAAPASTSAKSSKPIRFNSVHYDAKSKRTVVRETPVVLSR